MAAPHNTPIKQTKIAEIEKCNVNVVPLVFSFHVLGASAIVFTISVAHLLFCHTVTWLHASVCAPVASLTISMKYLWLKQWWSYGLGTELLADPPVARSLRPDPLTPTRQAASSSCSHDHRCGSSRRLADPPLKDIKRSANMSSRTFYLLITETNANTWQSASDKNNLFFFKSHSFCTVKFLSCT